MIVAVAFGRLSLVLLIVIAVALVRCLFSHFFLIGMHLAGSK